MTTSTENYQQTLLQLKKKLLASRFLRWWLGELSAMVPVKLRPTGLTAESLMFVRFDAADVVFSRLVSGQLRSMSNVLLQAPDAAQRQGLRTALDQSGASPRDVGLLLPPASVLRKSLTLPLATEENLRQVLEFQMEEHTPFSASQVYFGHRVTARNFERGQLTVEFVAAPRSSVDEALKTLASWDASVRAVVAEETLASGPPLLNLLPIAKGQAPSVFLHGVNPWLAALVVVLALAAMAAPALIKRQAVVQLLPWLDKGRTAAEAADTLRRDLETKVDEHNFLLEKRQQLPPVIMALEELTRILPDDTWVQQLDIKGKELQIQGETASSVRLIGLFEQSAIFRDASFRSSLTKGQGSGTERYQLALQLQPMAEKTANTANTASAAASAPVAAPTLAASMPAVSAATGAASASANPAAASTPPAFPASAAPAAALQKP